MEEGAEESGLDREESGGGVVLIEEDLLDADGHPLVYAGCVLPLQCEVGNINVDSEAVVDVQIPLYVRKGRVVPSQKDLLCLEPLMAAHSAALAAHYSPASGEHAAALAQHMQALAAQRECLDAGRLARPDLVLHHPAPPGLHETFMALRKLVLEMQGARVHTVTLTSDTLGTPGRDLMELPEGLRGLAAELRSLRVSSTMLNWIPEWIGELVNLESIHISGHGDADWANELRALPESIASLSKLRILELDNLLGLASLPPSIGKLTQLERLHIETCPHQDLLSSLGVVSTRLKELCLKGVEEPLPASIRAFAQLRRLELYAYESKDLPAWFGEMTMLQVLDMTGFGTMTEVPVSIGNLVGLHTLKLRERGFVELPSSIFASLSHLTSLTLACESLTGLPSSIFDNLRLTRLKFHECRKLRGPLLLERLTTLKTLKISFCKLLSLSPPSLLHSLDVLHCAKIDVDLPTFITRLTALRSLSLKPDTLFVSPTRAVVARMNLALAKALPSLVSLKRLSLTVEYMARTNVLAIGLALRAWPKPSLAICRNRYPSHNVGTQDILLADVWQEMGRAGVFQEMGLLSVATAELPEWVTDASILAYFALQQEKVAAFACVQHRRLGAASKAACLDDQTLSLIADEVLGRRVYDASLCMAAHDCEESSSSLSDSAEELDGADL